MADEPSTFDALLTELAAASLAVSLVTHAARVVASRAELSREAGWQLSLYRGHGQVTVAGETVAVDGLMVGLIPPGVEHAAVQNGRDLATLGLQFRLGGAAGSAVKLPALLIAPSPVSWADRLERDFQIILEDWQMAEAGARASVNARVRGLLVDVLRLWSQTDSDATSPAVVETACRFMAVQYGQPLTVRDVASHCGVRSDSLCRAFRRHMKMSPRGYLQELRLKQACNLLRVGLSVTDVAEQTGFGSVHYFSRAFKRAQGHSPTDWRRLQEDDVAVAADAR